jgi:hypothetical protein
VLVDGDIVNFLPTFGPAIVAVRPGRLSGSGPAKIGGKPACVEGDESKVSVPGCMYFTPQYSIAGVGTLKIQSLAPDQQTQTSKTGGKPMLLKGGSFTASFEVESPAQQPPPAPGPPIPRSGRAEQAGTHGCQPH